MYEQYKDRVAFYVVYIQEAHSSDVWQMASNIRDKVIFRTPQNFEERAEVASSCVRNLGIKIPAVVDDMNNSTERAYTGWPDRIYLIDRNGRVVLKTKPGPFGFNPSQLETHIQRINVAQTQALGLRLLRRPGLGGMGIAITENCIIE